MDNARTVFRRDVVIAGHDKSLLALLILDFLDGKRIKRLIFAEFEVLALITFQNPALPFDALENLVDKGLSENVLLVADLNLNIIDIRIDAEGEI